MQSTVRVIVDPPSPGYQLKINEAMLPDLLDFGTIFLGQIQEATIGIENGCISPLLVSARVVDEDGADLPSFSVQPGTLRLRGKTQDNADKSES